MKAKESATNVIRILADQGAGTPDAVFMVGVGRAAEVPKLVEAWPKAKWFGCEPSPEILYGKNFPGPVYPVAVSDKPSQLPFWLKKNHPHGSSLFNRHAKCDREIVVHATTLNMLQDEYGPFGRQVLLWMDCEGSEFAALRSADKFLARVRWINVEMTTEPDRDGWPGHAQVHVKLQDCGFVRVQTHSHHVGSGVYDAVYMRPQHVHWQEVLCPCSTRCRDD